LAISGLGHEATISELHEERGAIQRLWQRMDVNFVPGAAPAFVQEASADGTEVVYTTTVFETALTMDAAALADFSLSGYLSSVSTATGLSAERVSVESVVVDITVGYAFDESVTTDQVQTVVANANGVEESQVSVATAARRLTGGRRLADVNYDVVISVEGDDPSAIMEAASAIMTSSADADALTTALAAVAPDAPAPTVTQQPEAAVTVQTALVTSDGEAQAAPDSSALEDQIAADMDIEVVASTTVVSQTTRTCTDTCVDATVDLAAQGTASLALGMRGHLPLASLSAIALWSLAFPSA